MSFTDEFAAIVVDKCAKHEETHWKDTDYRACVFIGTEYFVKYDSPWALWPEVATQLYISEYAQSNADTPDTPRIAKVICHFKCERKMYLVMDAINLMDPPPTPHWPLP